jgi:hypothetical protein
MASDAKFLTSNKLFFSKKGFLHHSREGQENFERKKNKISIYHPTPIVTDNFHGKINCRTYCTLGPNPKPLTGG